ncbi:MAG: OpgC family protein, partial [Nevskiales bacterium]
MLSVGPAHGSSMGKASTRERRVDALRGVALVCIFVDHIPGSWLNWLTLRNFGLSDAAELFVMLSGFASMVAFGRTFSRDGARAGLRRIALRCLQLYVFQIGMLLTTLLTVWLWTSYYHLTPVHLAPMIYGGVAGIGRGLTLQAQPSNLNILPLYILLLAAFPAMYAGLRLRPAFTLVVSAAVWLAANLVRDLNLTNALDGNGWFFNPFAWQFLFALGTTLAMVMAHREGSLPRLPWLVLLCWLLLGLGFLQAFPWQQWDLPNLAPLAIDPPDKTNLSP